MADTMVERIARAMCVANGVDPDAETLPPPIIVDRAVYWERDERAVCAEWKRRVPDARAALEAMREPTEAMCRAGAQSDGLNATPFVYPHEIFAAMIDAVLAETPAEAHDAG